MADRDFKGVWIPKDIWLDERLNALEKVILVEIDSLDSTDSHCWKSNENLAEFCQCSATKVSNAISKLIKLGYVKVHSFDGRKRRLQSCLTFSVGEPYKNCKADLQNLQASNTYSNPLSNPDRYKEAEEESAGACEEVNPFGEGEQRLSTDTVQAYAANQLTVMSPRAMDELNGFVDDLSEDIVRHAIDNALDQGVRKWAYVKSILNDYVAGGVRNVADAAACDERHRKKRDGPKQGRGAIDRENNKVPLPYGGGIIV
jgi:DnaD/phage-associated family protein